jgi:hypothetical protein
LPMSRLRPRHPPHHLVLLLPLRTVLPPLLCLLFPFIILGILLFRILPLMSLLPLLPMCLLLLMRFCNIPAFRKNKG